ncbi:helix-turn-helix domain-containing protein [Candidatus Saccharibacteria bacterium]|nr:MAG: helix-turn-helix domain-containing protein [Candidatus Saccharibacteria bacterium]
MKHHHLADMVGVERESISRSLARLRRKNKIGITPEGRLQIIS